MSVRLARTLLGAEFANPIVLAAGTAGYGSELDGMIDIDALGGIVTKAVTPEPRAGNPAPRAASRARACSSTSAGRLSTTSSRSCARSTPSPDSSRSS